MDVVRSTSGVDVAVHDLGGEGPPLLVSHATGFHGRCYQPLADALAATVHSIAFDYRGHGETPRPDGPIDWQRYGDDAEAMALWVSARHGGGPIDGFGHSMGGACLLMAAHRHPGLFRRLIVFEPIVFPPEAADAGEPALAAGARRRRATFPSVEAAIEHYSSKPPMAAFAPAALRAYVEYGFAPDPEGIRLRCAPETEAATFAMGAHHTTWDVLPTIATHTVVVRGRAHPHQPAAIAAQVAERLADAHLIALDHLDHFGPMTHPVEIAQLVADELTGCARGRDTPSLR